MNALTIVTMGGEGVREEREEREGRTGRRTMRLDSEAQSRDIILIEISAERISCVSKLYYPSYLINFTPSLLSLFH